MPRVLLWILLLIMSLFSSAYAYTGFGICHFGKENIDKLICYGPTVLKETHIIHELKVAGMLNAKDATMGSLMITGAAKLDNVTVEGAAEITGVLKANKVRFQQGLNIIAHRIYLNQSSVVGPVKINSETDTPYLEMICGSKISGPIEFDGREGIIRMTSDSNIQGKVTNGKIENIQKKC